MDEAPNTEGSSNPIDESANEVNITNEIPNIEESCDPIDESSDPLAVDTDEPIMIFEDQEQEIIEETPKQQDQCDFSEFDFGSSIGKFKCILCVKVFKNKTDYNNHFNEEHITKIAANKSSETKRKIDCCRLSPKNPPTLLVGFSCFSARY